jgi:hypothetical protein
MFRRCQREKTGRRSYVAAAVFLLASSALLFSADGVNAAPPTAEKPPEPPPVVAQMSISPKKLTLGEAAKLYVRITHPRHITVTAITDRLSRKPFRIVGKWSRVEQKESGEQVEEVWQATIVAMRKGLKKVPPARVHYRDEKKQTGQIKTAPLAVNIGGRLDLTTPQGRIISKPPPADPMKVYTTNTVLIIVLSALGLVIVTAFMTWFGLRYASRVPRRGPPPPLPRPAHLIANEKLAELELHGHLQVGRFKEFAVGLSEILREYLGLRYATDTLEMTSRELMGHMKAIGPQGLSVYKLQSFLDETDMIKFAKARPSYDQMEAKRGVCSEVIEATRMTDDQIASQRNAEEMRRLLEKPAHPFKRLFAVMIDLLMFSFLSTGLIAIANSMGSTWLYWVDGALLLLFVLARDSFGEGSPGKMLTGLAVTPLNDTRSELVTTGARWLRNITLLFPVAGQTMEFMVMTYAADSRRVGDRWSNTRVLDRRPDASEKAYLLYGLASLAGVVIVGGLLPYLVLS